MSNETKNVIYIEVNFYDNSLKSVFPNDFTPYGMSGVHQISNDTENYDLLNNVTEKLHTYYTDLITKISNDNQITVETYFINAISNKIANNKFNLQLVLSVPTGITLQEKIVEKLKKPYLSIVDMDKTVEKAITPDDFFIKYKGTIGSHVIFTD